MTIAVTAASGHLGAEIVKATSALVGQDGVVGIARSPEKAAGLGVEIRAGDYRDKAQFEKALQGVESVLLVSGMDAPEKRISQHRNVIEAAVSNGVRKIVYTSVQGPDSGTAFSPIVDSNRQTEQDIRDTGLEWVIGRNGIYIEPDVEYIETYKSKGEIANCAGDGKCGYTTRSELAYAYARVLTEPKHNSSTYILNGEPITQQQLAEYFNSAFGTKLVYRPMSVEDYRKERVAELGEFIGTVIAGIYEGIQRGHYDSPSDFEAAAGRPHQSWDDYFDALV
ncbi:MAG: SDR family oxidoreductase [Woeseia sp.]|nr:SDR family oxidoreductase [Woeseia sp.]